MAVATNESRILSIQKEAAAPLLEDFIILQLGDRLGLLAWDDFQQNCVCITGEIIKHTLGLSVLLSGSGEKSMVQFDLGNVDTESWGLQIGDIEIVRVIFPPLGYCHPL